MSSKEYLDLLYESWPEDAKPSQYLMGVADRAITEHSDSPDILCAYADLLQLRAIHDPNEEVSQLLDDAEYAYKRAIELNPQFNKACESLGYLYDTFGDSPSRAEKYFRDAIRLGAGADSFVGLARVLAEQGKQAEALGILGSDFCPYHASEQVATMRSRIEQGDWDPI